MREIDKKLACLRMPLVRALRRRGIPEDEAEDLAQESSLRALQAGSQPDFKQALLPWILKIALRCRIDRTRRKTPDPLRLRVIENVSPVESAIRSEQRNRVHAAIATLSQDQQDAVQAFYERGKTLKQIASESGIAEGTIKARLHRAREELALRLRKERDL